MAEESGACAVPARGVLRPEEFPNLFSGVLSGDVRSPSDDCPHVTSLSSRFHSPPPSNLAPSTKSGTIKSRLNIWLIPAILRHQMIVDTLSPAPNQRLPILQPGLPMRQLPTHQMVCA
jgi:hypothetical protein